MSWSQPPDQQPPQGGTSPRPGDPGWAQVPPDQWPGSEASRTSPAGAQPPPQVQFGSSTLAPSPYPYIAPKRRGCGGLGCIIGLIVAVAVVVPIIAVVVGMRAFAGDDFLGQISEIVDTVSNIDAALGISTTPLPGEASTFDPFAALPEVTAFAGAEAQLAEIEAVQVRSDGTQNLNADYAPPRPRTTYTYFREVPRPENAPPLGAGGSAGDQWYEPITIEAYQPGAMSQITRTGGGMNIQTQFVNQGLKRQVNDPTNNLAFYDGGFVAAPKCTTRQLWSAAL
ncbi:MAG TPA: hypothetical protein VER79_12460, partial [Candidatus Limnocylindrales bacterium]|nr:hypothetical protein [Candidatus Limnocylindrales bacterium]